MVYVRTRSATCLCPPIGRSIDRSIASSKLLNFHPPPPLSSRSALFVCLRLSFARRSVGRSRSLPPVLALASSSPSFLPRRFLLRSLFGLTPLNLMQRFSARSLYTYVCISLIDGHRRSTLEYETIAKDPTTPKAISKYGAN